MAKTVLITGCSPGGIGHALAREFKARGLRVFATARKAESISDLEQSGIETLSLEVTDLNSIKALKDEVALRTGGRLDILVNNAGRNYTVPALDVEIEEIRSTFEVNLFAVIMMCQIFMPLLIEAQGTIVQIGSLAGVMPYVFGSVYNASKAALHSYSNTLRVEVAPLGVRVVTVITGGVKSNIARTHRSLPKDSLYLQIEDIYDKRQVHSQSQAIPNEDYARTVVRQILNKPSKDTLWEGGSAWLVWLLSSFFPRYVMARRYILFRLSEVLTAKQDMAMTRMFSLWKLEQSNTKKLA